MACALASQTRRGSIFLDPGSHSRPACVATQHTANVLVEANVVLNSSVQRVHVNRTHASNVLVAEG